MYSFGENKTGSQKKEATNKTMSSNGSNASSAPTTPVSFPSHPVPFFDVSHQNDDNVWDLQDSRRCPTFKDYAEKVKQLQQENFQLRVRIFMNEQKTGVKTCSSDFAALFQQNYHHLQSALNAHNLANPGHSTTASSFTANHDLHSNLTSLKTQNEELQSKLKNMETKVHNLEKALKDKQTENDNLLDKYNNIRVQLQDMETEVALNRVKLQQQQNQARLKNDEEVERAARIAFGSFDEDVGDSNRHDLEVKLMEENCKIQNLEKKVSKMQKDIEKYQKTITALEKEKKEADTKLIECSKALMEFGKRNLQLTKEVEGLQTTMKQQQRSINDTQTVDSIVVRKFSSIKQSASLLQNRLFEIINFIETLFTLESKKVLTLTGLNDSNRKSLWIAVEQCKLHSYSLDELLSNSEESEISRKLNSSGNKLDQDITFNSHRYSLNDSVFGSTRKLGKSVAIQVDLLSSRSKQEAELVETVKRLTLEQTSRIAQIASLESRLRSATDHIASLEKPSRTISNQAYEALQTENKTLNTRVRVTESALLKLHQQHAKIVGELKELRHSHAECFQEKETTDRPSDSTSPDLGIDSGHDGAVNSDDSNSSNNYKAENRALRNANRELAHKLNDTRKILNNTLEKLHTTSKQKEQVEKAICRQLHKTHTILRQAKKNVEIYTAANSQENVMPSMHAFNSTDN